ncbi:efflux RND transporter periplasmic adaptor subunit [Ruminococcus sp. HUN007]|uniref:efflux RND transporter periplasmic adaptor subunit n=1 Tax=Ruminococcus sp. HUN007 TaxID=1514668 RepID=UPI0005D2B85A|nr:efflux RND transporter periplasmic adaptor subunit [Ruminococcus sp. HUN007]
MNRKMLRVTALLCSVCLLSAGCGKKSDSSSLKKVNVAELSEKDLSETLELGGTVESTEKDSTVMTDLTNLKVTKLYVSVGDSVKAGDILCELDSSEIEKNIANLEKNISDSSTLYDYKYQQLQKELENTRKSGQLDIDEANKKLEDARNSYNSEQNSYNENRARYESLTNEANDLQNQALNAGDEVQAKVLMEQYKLKMGEVAAAMSAYETANSKMQSLKETIAMYEKAVESAKISAKSQADSAQYNIDTYSLTNSSDTDNKNRLEELKKDLEKTKVRATGAGVIATIPAEEGKVCRDGILMTLQNASNVCVHVSIDEKDLLSVKSGMKAVVTIPARKDDEYSGVVDRVLDIKSANGFDGYINIDDPTNFRIGMKATVVITTLDAENTLAVTKKSVFSDRKDDDSENEDDKKFYVYEAEKQSDNTYKLRKVEVTKGNENNTYVEISGEGLEKGDYIVSMPGRCKEDDIVDVKVTGKNRNDTDEEKGENDDE